MMDTKTGEIIYFVIYSMSEPDLTKLKCLILNTSQLGRGKVPQ